MSSVITMSNADSGAFSGGGGGGGTGTNYVAGEAIDITKKSNTGTISVKFDNDTITLNDSGQLQSSITAGDAIELDHGAVSVKFDNDTITLDSSGRLKAVTSTGPSDSLFERRVIKYAGDYDWTKFDDTKHIQINGEQIPFSEYTDFPHEYTIDNSVIVRFYTDDPKYGEIEIRKENGQYICPKVGASVEMLTPLDYHCTGDRIGIIGSYWPSIWDVISIETEIKTESNLGYEVISHHTNHKHSHSSDQHQHQT